jgi:hypothetical protein
VCSHKAPFGKFSFYGEDLLEFGARKAAHVKKSRALLRNTPTRVPTSDGNISETGRYRKIPSSSRFIGGAFHAKPAMNFPFYVWLHLIAVAGEKPF